MSLFRPIVIQEKENATAPIAEQMAEFERHKQALLTALQKGSRIGSVSEPFDSDNSWTEIVLLARLYFLGKVDEQSVTPSREHIKRLRDLAKALRKAHGLTQRAMRDGTGDELFRAWFALNMTPLSYVKIDEIDQNDGSSLLSVVVDDIKGMAGALARLNKLSDTAVTAADVPRRVGRPALLPWECIQGLARVYRKWTHSRPGRGSGPFADFAFAFMCAVGQSGFDYESLTAAIQEAHRKSLRKIERSWFDEAV